MRSIVGATVLCTLFIAVVARWPGVLAAEELPIGLKPDPLDPLADRKARSPFEGEADRGDDERQPTKLAQALAERGLALAKKRRYQAALAHLDKAVQIDPQNILAQLGRAQCLLGMDRYAEAAEPIREAIRIQPDEPGHHHLLASVLMHSADFDGAVVSMNEAIRLGKRDAAAFRRRATAFYFKGEYQHVIDDCDEAIRLDPRDSSTHAARASAHEKLGQYDRAAEDYDRAVELAPNSLRLRFLRALVDVQRSKQRPSRRTSTTEKRPVPSE